MSMKSTEKNWKTPATISHRTDADWKDVVTDAIARGWIKTAPARVAIDVAEIRGIVARGVALGLIHYPAPATSPKRAALQALAAQDIAGLRTKQRECMRRLRAQRSAAPVGGVP